MVKEIGNDTIYERFLSSIDGGINLSPSCSFMKTSFLIMFSLVLACSCSEKDQNRIVSDFTIIDPTLTKSPNDTFKIGRADLLSGFPFYFFKDSKGFCKLRDDTIKIFLIEGTITRTIMNLKISKYDVDADIWVHSCHSSIHYKAIMTTLKLNKEAFHIGDTIIGELNYHGLPIFEDKSIEEDTLRVKGKFKFVVRSENFTFEDLTKEKNYKNFTVPLQSNPNTIYEVDLSNSGITEIPKEIQLFKNLRVLNLEGNDLSRADFSMLKHLPRLRKLNIGRCNLTKIPSSIFNLTKLDELDIYFNKINELPEELFTLTNLRELQIGGNYLKSLSPNISKLTNLEWIEFSSTQIWKLPDEMTCLTSLKEIYPNDTMVYIPSKLKPLLASSCEYVASK
jgi:Leucine-rich repeat (LRR) protein